MFVSVTFSHCVGIYQEFDLKTSLTNTQSGMDAAIINELNFQ